MFVLKMIPWHPQAAGWHGGGAAEWQNDGRRADPAGWPLGPLGRQPGTQCPSRVLQDFQNKQLPAKSHWRDAVGS